MNVSVRRRLVVAVVVVVALIAALALWLWPTKTTTAQPPTTTLAPAKPKESPPKKTAARGRVLFGEVTDDDGSPIAFARVTGPGVDVKATDAGQFTIDPLPQSLPALHFEAEGFLAADVDAARLPHEGEAFWSQRLVRSSDGLRVRVVVDDASKAPIARAGIYGVDRIPLGVTNEAGVAVVAISVASVGTDNELIVAHGTHGVVRVERFEKTGELVVALPPTSTLDGSIVDAAGHGLDGAVVIDADDDLSDRAALLLRRLRRDYPVDVNDDGSFHADVAAGGLSVVARAPGKRPSKPTELTLEPGVSKTLRFVLDDSPRVAGIVVDKVSGAPIANATLTLDGARAPDAVTDLEGRFVLDSFTDRATSVVVRKSGYRAQTLGGLEGGQRNPVDGTLRVELSRGAGTEVVGIGVVTDPGEGVLIVKRVERGSPAEAAGVVVDDRIVEVDGARLGDDTNANLARVRGQAGTAVRLGITRAGRRVDVEVTRGIIPMDPSRR